MTHPNEIVMGLLKADWICLKKGGPHLQECGAVTKKPTSSKAISQRGRERNGKERKEDKKVFISWHVEQEETVILYSN